MYWRLFRKKIDEFDEKYYFMLKYKLTSKDEYEEVKNYYFKNKTP